MSLISPNFDVKSVIFPDFGQGPFPKTAGKSPAFYLVTLCLLMNSSIRFEWITEAQLVRLGIKGSLVRDSQDFLCCILVQDTLSAAYSWFNPGRQEIIPT